MAHVVESRKACAVNPLKMSQPLGASLAFLGLDSCMPVMHGSQGCTSFGLVLLVRHFKEAIPLQTTAMNEATTVMAMGRLNDVWDQLFPAERHRIANLMIERIDLIHVGEVQGIKVKWRELGWDALIGEFAPREIGAELVEMEA